LACSSREATESSCAGKGFDAIAEEWRGRAGDSNGLSCRVRIFKSSGLFEAAAAALIAVGYESLV